METLQDHEWCHECAREMCPCAYPLNLTQGTCSVKWCPAYAHEHGKDEKI